MSRHFVCQYNVAQEWEPPRLCLHGTSGGAKFCAGHVVEGAHQEALEELAARRRTKWPFWPGIDADEARATVHPAVPIEDGILQEVAP